MDKKTVFIVLVITIFLSGCVGSGINPTKTKLEVSGMKVYRSSWDFGNVDPKLNLDNMVVTKVKGTCGQKQSNDETPPGDVNVKVRMTIPSSETAEWSFHQNRGTKTGLFYCVDDADNVPDSGSILFTAEGKNTDWLGRETNEWHVSDRKSKSYSVSSSTSTTLGYIAFRDDRTPLEKFFSTDYTDLLSEPLRGNTKATEWLDSKISELKKAGNPLSSFLTAYTKPVAIVILDSNGGVRYKTILKSSSGKLIETTATPSGIAVIENKDLNEIMEKYISLSQDGWTSKEIMEMKLLILSKIKFQGDMIPRT